MRVTWTCLLMLVISAFCLQAQEGNPGADVWVSADTYPPVIEGCLQRWGFYYKVIGSDGTIYNLTRGSRGLSHYVGHDVEVTGKPTIISLDTTNVHAASTVEEFPALAVKRVKELSKTCSLGQQ